MDFHRVYWSGAKLENYMQKAQAIAPANLIALWPLNELSGTTAFDQSGNGRNGAYVNGPTLGQTGIGDGGTSALFVPANGTFVNVFSAAFAAAFSGPEGSVVGWLKPRAASVWTDATIRYIFQIAVDANNLIYLQKTATNNQLQWAYKAGGTTKFANVTYSATTWTSFGLTWTKAGDAVKFYLNAAQQGATQNALGTWAGVPANGNCGIASSGGGGSIWDGYEGLIGVWSTALSQAQITAWNTVP